MRLVEETGALARRRFFFCASFDYGSRIPPAGGFRATCRNANYQNGNDQLDQICKTQNNHVVRLAKSCTKVSKTRVPLQAKLLQTI